ncbi:MAG TPA: hypothetical protein DEU95_09380 [Chloroflexi bacterium]|nr:hypothetical protein [Chloroflexota bacterium]
MGGSHAELAERRRYADMSVRVERRDDCLPFGRSAGRPQRRELRVGRAIVLARVARDVDLRRIALLEGVIPDLHLAGDELDDQQPIGHAPRAVSGNRCIGRQLHTTLVEVLNGALAAVRLGVVLLHRWGERGRPPHPGSGDRSVDNRLVSSGPGALEGVVGWLLGGRLCLRERDENQYRRERDDRRPHRS